MMDKIESRIINLLEENVELTVPIDEIKLDQELEVLGLSSVSFIKLIVAVEAEFDFEVDDENLKQSNFKTLQDLVDYIKNSIS